MIGSSVKVTVAGAEKSAPLRPSVIVAFEREWKVGYLAALGDPDKSRLEHMIWIAWCALKKDGQVVKLFSDFVEEVDDWPSFVAAPKEGSGPLPETP